MQHCGKPSILFYLDLYYFKIEKKHYHNYLINICILNILVTKKPIINLFFHYFYWTVSRPGGIFEKLTSPAPVSSYHCRVLTSPLRPLLYETWILSWSSSFGQINRLNKLVETKFLLILCYSVAYILTLLDVIHENYCC